MRDRFPGRRFEGFYGLVTDLEGPPGGVPQLPVHYDGHFVEEGRLDVNPVTWHELAERAIVVRGRLPEIHTDLTELLEFTKANLDTYWRRVQLAQLTAAGPARAGALDWAVVWVCLGVARLHHLLARHELTSKSGAGRYVLEALDARWHLLAREALALRESPGAPSLYADPLRRGDDLRGFLTYAIDDAQRF